MGISPTVNSDGFAWRILLGPTHNWAMSQLEVSKDVEGLCQLCGQSIDNGMPFVTNSTGEQATHIACSSEQKTATTEIRPGQKIWAQPALVLLRQLLCLAHSLMRLDFTL